MREQNRIAWAIVQWWTSLQNSKKYLYKDFFKISKLDLLLISLGSEFQNLMADIWKVFHLLTLFYTLDKLDSKTHIYFVFQ